eukprot:scaffold4753_cov58-Phaeocystis_antarctica.AAC.3
MSTHHAECHDVNFCETFVGSAFAPRTPLAGPGRRGAPRGARPGRRGTASISCNSLLSVSHL